MRIATPLPPAQLRCAASCSRRSVTALPRRERVALVQQTFSLSVLVPGSHCPVERRALIVPAPLPPTPAGWISSRCSMDSSNHAAHSRSQPFDPARPSIDAPARLIRKRSVSRSQYKSSVNTPLSSQNVKGESKVRKGSLRNAVRKIFTGRRANRDSDVSTAPDPLISAFRRPQPQSVSETLFIRRGSAGRGASSSNGGIAHQRIASAPAPLNLRSTRSPYAVEFPQSARLKPLDLGNPFDAPGSQLRRRKTLPSIHIPDNDAVIPSTSVNSSAGVPPVPSLTTASRDTPTPDAIAAAIKIGRRKSRSADDLKGAARAATLLRNRSDEIRYWRESFPPPEVLRLSGFVTERVTPPQQKQSHAGDEIPVAPHTDLYKSGVDTASNSPAFRYVPAAGDTDTVSGSGYTELSRELEDRVANLESGLSNFRRDLQRLATERNRRTVLVQEGQTSMDERSPSMLAETLRNPMEHSTYQYEYGRSDREASRPYTPYARPSQQLPATRFATIASAEDPFTEKAAPPPPARIAEPASITEPARIAEPASTEHQGGETVDSTTSPQPYTFRSLYEMLSDERFARRKLEKQLKNLRNEIQNLQHQVSVSQLHSERNSYTPIIADPIPMRGSIRLHHILRDTEPSPPRAMDQSREPGTNGLLYHETDGVVSRFSASESEAGLAAPEEEDGDEPLPTPLEAYQTPVEEWNAQEHGFATARLDGPYVPTLSDDPEMF